LDLNGYPLAAVRDALEVQSLVRLNLTPDDGYFNTGVLLVDLNQWRSIDFTKECLRIIEKDSQRIVWADQDVLNILWKKNWYQLPECWNFQTIHQRSFASQPTQIQVDPKIIHFTGSGSSKPWHHACKSPFVGIYRNAKQATPWAKLPLEHPPPSLVFRVKCFLKEIITDASSRFSAYFF
jgi:lipopolysaccharide biosynthesis glycosyltransferase